MELHVIDKCRFLIKQLELKEAELSNAIKEEIANVDHYALPEVLNKRFKEIIDLKLSTLNSLVNLEFNVNDIREYYQDKNNSMRLKDNYNQYLNTVNKKIDFIVITALNKKLPEYGFLELNMNNIELTPDFKSLFIKNFMLGLMRDEVIPFEDIEKLAEESNELLAKYVDNKVLTDRLAKEFKVKDDDFKYIPRNMNIEIANYCGGVDKITHSLVKEFFENMNFGNNNDSLLNDTISNFNIFTEEQVSLYENILNRLSETLYNKLLEDVEPEIKASTFTKVITISEYLFRVVASLISNNKLNIKEFFDIRNTEIRRAEDYIFDVAKIAQGMIVEKE